MVLKSILLVLLSGPLTVKAALKPAETDARPAELAGKPDAGAVAEKPSAEPKPVAAADGGVKAAPRPALAADVKALVDRMQAFYEKTDDFKAQFRQDYLHKAFKRTQTSSGTMTFKKPGLLRWEYEKPSPKAIVLAGDKVYLYDPEAMMLTKSSIDTSQLSASVTFLFGKGKLADEFSIARAACDKCQGALLELTPLRPDPRFRRLRLEVDEKSARVLKSTVVDPDGSENAITFLDFKPNVGVGQEQFKINPAPGTQVQDLTQGAK